MNKTTTKKGDSDQIVPDLIYILVVSDWFVKLRFHKHIYKYILIGFYATATLSVVWIPRNGIS